MNKIYRKLRNKYDVSAIVTRKNASNRVVYTVAK